MAQPQQPLQAPPEAGSMTAAHRELLAGTPDVIAPGHTFGSVTDKIAGIVLTHRTPIGWFLGFAVAFLFLMILNVTIVKLLFTGIGIWGNNIPVGWAFDIINFVWWIGIGHAGTLISAILLLFRQQWRTSINRFAEAMTLFAVACAESRRVARSGIRPVNQNSSETVKYVETANTSQMSGLRNCGHSCIVFGYGNSQ